MDTSQSCRSMCMGICLIQTTKGDQYTEQTPNNCMWYCMLSSNTFKAAVSNKACFTLLSGLIINNIDLCLVLLSRLSILA